MPKMPSEEEQLQQSLEFFQKHLCQKFDLNGPFALKKAIDLIEEFEEEQKSYNPFGEEFSSFNDRFNAKNEEKLVQILEKKLFG